MRVAEYRDLIDAVFNARRSLQSAATSDEQRNEAMRLADAVAYLSAATCRTATSVDTTRAWTAMQLADLMLAKKRQQFQAADAFLSRLSFGTEYR